MARLTLTGALKSGKLRAFVAQEEKRLAAAVSEQEFDEAIKKAVKQPRSNVEHRVPHLAVVLAADKKMALCSGAGCALLVLSFVVLLLKAG